MALYSQKIVDGKTVKVEERTYRVEVLTPKTEAGLAGYSAVAYRERIESIDGVVTSLIRLPPLRVPLTPNISTVMSLIAGTVDTLAAQSIEKAKWPLDAQGNLIPV